MRRITSVGSGNRSAISSFDRTSIGRGKLRRMARRQGVSVETLESRRLLATWTALIVPDGSANSLRYYIDKANTNAQNDTINLKYGRYELAIPNTLGQENANKEGDLDVYEANKSLTLKGAGINKTFIDANQLDRVLHTFNNTTLILKDLTITGGLALDVGGDAA